ncbi:MAG TPA: tetratricopeptide repeat protein [Acidimicrobiales bacterium]|nr:tetratricopeptide repeat protein [Acidimicrobiales bacterium]
MATDVTDATFQTDVLDRSADVTVVVDLWAPWCGPCRTLGPVIEKVVGETEGVELVKVNVDDNPGVANAFRVQSIPAVFAIRDKQVVDGFIGALPEAQVRQWVDALAPAPSEADVLVQAGDEASLRRALELQPDHTGAILGLAELLIATDPEEALALLARIPESPETRRIAALARVGGEQDGYEEKLDGLLPRVKDDEAARQEFLDLLELMGPDDPRTADYRRKLTSALF